jgi:hypothetical protein
MATVAEAIGKDANDIAEAALAVGQIVRHGGNPRSKLDHSAARAGRVQSHRRRGPISCLGALCGASRRSAT